jgi:hypothetical protein
MYSSCRGKLLSSIVVVCTLLSGIKFIVIKQNTELLSAFKYSIPFPTPPISCSTPKT